MDAAALPSVAWAMSSSTLVSSTFSTPRHTTHYIACGPADGPLMIFLHGWPGIGLIWRAQMEAFANDGWHCVAPDLRGYGGSSAPAADNAYTIKDIVADMAELHDHLGGQPAIWVGHDWGSAVAGALAAHEPERSRGVVLTSLAYFPDAFALPTLVPLVDRTLYPADRYPDDQWDYYRYYTTHFEAAVADLDADLAATLASIYRSGDPTAIGKIRRQRWSRATEGATAPRTALRRPKPTPRFGRLMISMRWSRRSRLMASALPARGT